MALCKPGLIMDQNGKKTELATTFSGRFPHTISTVSVKRFKGYMLKFTGPYINQTLLWINMAEHRNCRATFRESTPYRIWRESVQLHRFWYEVTERDAAGWHDLHIKSSFFLVKQSKEEYKQCGKCEIAQPFLCIHYRLNTAMLTFCSGCWMVSSGSSV
jgi:hypothetical protein